MTYLTKSFVNLIFLISFSFSAVWLNAQDVELTGAILIGRTEASSYSITYQMFGEKIVGYSISDINGPDETKAKIVGKYSKKTKIFQFEETEILFTKSLTPISEFCLMKVNGTLDKKLGKPFFQGDFTAENKDRQTQSCEGGTIIMSTPKAIYEVASKVAKNLPSNSIPDSISAKLGEKLNELKAVDQVKRISTNETVSFKWKSDSIRIQIWDEKLEDGDKVRVLKNNEVWISDLRISNAPQIISVPIEKSSAVDIAISAISEGKYPPCTVKALLLDKNESQLLLVQLKLGETAFIKIKR
ncbi:MAG: hypothetical protein IPK61_15690 [Saprospiraceae bacterium]|nr:hypothetical protein [Saprospiraceae bacterium]